MIFPFPALPDLLDLTDPEHHRQIRRATDAVVAASVKGEELEVQERALLANKDQYPFSAHLVLKMARSRSVLSMVDTKLHISVVFALYKEHTRILTRDQHAHGENFLMEKIKQMAWLCRGLPNISWDMIVVDDGCPMKSGVCAQEILNAHRSAESDLVQVLFLDQAIRQGHPATVAMRSTDESRKGGSITLGLWEAAKGSASNAKDDTIIIFTDADLSTDLGQCGLLVDGILNKNADAAIGSRRETDSVVIKEASRNTRGKLFIYLWKRLLPNLIQLVDTQCGFKAFRAETARIITQNMRESQFAFDIELLLKTELNRPGSIIKVPVAWFDSDAASTTTDLQPYLTMLKSIAGFYRAYLPHQSEVEGFANLIDQLDESQWNLLLENIPTEISRRHPAEFGHFNGITASRLSEIAGLPG
ncbi:MAG: hypothetical protein HQL67_00315 [Magnetococcales bacterium]|nr:hypothetical protein [Magnetococcales bacterium]